MRVARSRPVQLVGYTYKDWRGHIHVLSLVTHTEYWSTWISPTGEYRLKITQWLNIQQDGTVLHVGTLDSYDWLCIAIHAQLTCVHLAKPVYVRLSYKGTPKQYNRYKRKLIRSNLK